MKPNTTTSRQSDLLDEKRFSSGRGSNHPLIDYQFHSSLSERQIGGATSDQKAGRSGIASPFLDLSRDFLEVETKRDYVTELLFFGVMVAVSAWPIISMMKALGALLK
jgi:hypothetical protein